MLHSQCDCSRNRPVRTTHQKGSKNKETTEKEHNSILFYSTSSYRAPTKQTGTAVWVQTRTRMTLTQGAHSLMQSNPVTPWYAHEKYP